MGRGRRQGESRIPLADSDGRRRLKAALGPSRLALRLEVLGCGEGWISFGPNNVPSLGLRAIDDNDATVLVYCQQGRTLVGHLASQPALAAALREQLPVEVEAVELPREGKLWMRVVIDYLR